MSEKMTGEHYIQSEELAHEMAKKESSYREVAGKLGLGEAALKKLGIEAEAAGELYKQAMEVADSMIADAILKGKVENEIVMPPHSPERKALRDPVDQALIHRLYRYDPENEKLVAKSKEFDVNWSYGHIFHISYVKDREVFSLDE